MVTFYEIGRAIKMKPFLSNDILLTSDVDQNAILLWFLICDWLNISIFIICDTLRQN